LKEIKVDLRANRYMQYHEHKERLYVAFR